MKRQYALFAFNGEPMCFAHVLLNALDLDSKGYAVQLIIEGSATKLIADFEQGEAPFKAKYLECIEKGLLAGVCRACSAKMGSLESAERQGLVLLDDMSGHPSIERFIRDGYEIISF
jgi:hypothetical protein